MGTKPRAEVLKILHPPRVLETIALVLKRIEPLRVPICEHSRSDNLETAPRVTREVFDVLSGSGCRAGGIQFT
jgi:hypothetical protein